MRDRPSSSQSHIKNENENEKNSPISSKKLSAFVNNLSNDELKVLVMKSDFLHAARSTKPSVSRSELDHYEELGEEFNDVTS